MTESTHAQSAIISGANPAAYLNMYVTFSLTQIALKAIDLSLRISFFL